MVDGTRDSERPEVVINAQRQGDTEEVDEAIDITPLRPVSRTDAHNDGDESPDGPNPEIGITNVKHYCTAVKARTVAMPAESCDTFASMASSGVAKISFGS